MRFIKDGPDIPERLLHAQEEGRLIFFCGAGISAGLLPTFSGLVDRLFNDLNTRRNPIEEKTFQKGEYDKVIMLLEQRYPGGREKVRECLFQILQVSSEASLLTHQALLNLAKNNKNQYRLVTTNFDRLFELAIQLVGNPIKIFEAPLVPKPNYLWNGLIYLHGLLPSTLSRNSLDHLVLSSGDFGLAYLTHGWASDFVAELLRNFTVCFVGYSVDDPVIRYMMDALAADRLRGGPLIEAFAITSHKMNKGPETLDAWKAKNVTPILYDSTLNHNALHTTLNLWGAAHRDGVLSKEHTVIKHAMSVPFTSIQEDHFVDQMLWALSDPSGLPAKRFAEYDPLPSFEWFEYLKRRTLNINDFQRFGILCHETQDSSFIFSLLCRPASYIHTLPMALVNNKNVESQWDKIMPELARWLIRHISNPKLMLWVVEQGGKLHPRFARMIESALNNSSMPNIMKKLWHLVLNNQLYSHDPQPHLATWWKSCLQNGFTKIQRSRLRELLSPCVSLQEHIVTDELNNSSDSAIHFSIPFRLELMLKSNDIQNFLETRKNDPQWKEILPLLLEDFTHLLRDSLELMEEFGQINTEEDNSYIDRPSIAPHAQNHNHQNWTGLIELNCDSWLETAKTNPNQALQMARKWLQIPYPLFKRLAFFAATHSEIIPSKEGLKWLLDDKTHWFWSNQTKRESIRLLVSLASKLDAQDQIELENIIIQGPPEELLNSLNERLTSIECDYLVWQRLAKYSQSRMSLGRMAQDKLENLAKQHPDWQFRTDERDEFPFWMSSTNDLYDPLFVPENVADLIVWLKQYPTHNVFQRDNWEECCSHNFSRAIEALKNFNNDADLLLISGRWIQALNTWSKEEFITSSWNQLKHTLASASVELIKKISHSLSWWLKSVASRIDHDPLFFILIPFPKNKIIKPPIP